MFKPGLRVIIVAIISQTSAMAQVYVKNTGNVGIGISTPSTKLDVNGDITAGNAIGGYHLIVNDVPTARWALGTGNYGFHIANDYPVTGTWAEKFVINRDGNVGIGVTNPSAKLELANAGNASLRVGVTSNMANTHTQLINSLAVIGDNSTSITASGAVAYDFFNNGNNPTWAGTILYHYGNGFSDQELLWGIKKRNLGMLHFQNESGGAIVSSDEITIVPGYTVYHPTIFHPNGNVSIGYATGHNPEKRLEINGSVWATSYYTTSGRNYADYVFDSTFQLPTLNQVETYIKQNHHLPEVPSEAEVKKDGINLGEHQVILLKKVEELTLYAIEQDKKQLELDEKVKALEQKIEVLMQANNKLAEKLLIKKAKKKKKQTEKE